MTFNKLPLLAVLSVFLLLGAGCQAKEAQETQDQVTDLPPAVEELQNQIVPEIAKQEKAETTTNTDQASAGTKLFRGFYFDISYPENFTAKPTEPTTVYNGQTYVQTDEAYFNSPDGKVEFFVYSPLWSGNPQTYLAIDPTEEIVSEKTDQDDDKIVKWVTVKAKDNSYYRSFVSIKEQIGTGSDTHHVFGIKYLDNVSYEKYKDAYVAFKESLRQYAD